MAYANVAIAPPSPRSRLVLDERLIQEIVDTVQQSLNDYLRNSRQSVTLSTPLPPVIEPPIIEPPIIEPPVIEPPAIEPPADKSNSYGIDYSPVGEPPSVQADFTIQPVLPVQPVQPRLPPPCRLYVQTTTHLLLYAPCVSNTYIRCYWDALFTGIKLGALVEFRDTG
ncbi:hypothetical protein BGZ57DRAFT_908033 [Hyaloscypha finlandica]|nr:hypothetical protein BGZ57DRAFT_908033 [Hyaloscypha finlandica]